jgi:hypothetical protein
MDNTNPAVDDSTVPSTHDSNTDLINLYSVGHMSVREQWKEGRDEVPFKQTLQLKGPQGEIVQVSALFDGGAMVGAMCSTIFRMIKHRLSGWGPSRRQLRMANGTIIPSEAVWKGAMVLGGVTFRGEFEVFDSKGGWAFLFGKPLMRAAGAIYDFATDIVSIRSGNGTVTLANQINEHTAEHATTLGVSLTLDAKQWGIEKGGSSGWKPPSRQVSITQTNAATEQIDKHEHITESTTGHETLLEATQGVQECENNTPDNGTEDKTHGNENSEETKGVDDTPTGEVIIDVVTDRLAYETDSTNPYNSESENLTQINAIGTETGSIFTRHTDPFKTERVTKILEQITLGDDLTHEQQETVKAVVVEFADCFALAISEVNTVPGISHKLKIPEGATFQTKIGQRSMTPPQWKYLNDKVDEMLAAGIIAPIHPRDVRNVAPTVLAQKAHDGYGLPLDELKHQVNDECIAHGITSALNMPPRPEPRETPKGTTESQKWRICQDFNNLNKVTQIAPMPQGDIRAKQLRLSGHRYIHVFDFAAGFYAIAIHPDSQPYIVFYIEGRGYLKYLRMPFGVTGGPSEFGDLTAQKLHDLISKAIIELFIDDGSSAADTFEEGLLNLRVILERVHQEKLSLAPSKLKLFMTEAVFAGATVGPNGVSPDPTKLTAIVNWPKPEDASHLEGFLGLTGHFRDLVKGYAKVEKPLRDILRNVDMLKGIGKQKYQNIMKAYKLKNIWTKEYTETFVKLKSTLISEPVLRPPHFDGTPFILTTDGSKDTFAGVLSQRITTMLAGGKKVT